jgi:hypothetical protein
MLYPSFTFRIQDLRTQWKDFKNAPNERIALKAIVDTAELHEFL